MRCFIHGAERYKSNSFLETRMPMLNSMEILNRMDYVRHALDSKPIPDQKGWTIMIAEMCIRLNDKIMSVKKINLQWKH